MIPASREATFLASVASTVCVMSMIVVLPIMHTHFQRKVSMMLSHVELCKIESRDIWKQMSFSEPVKKKTRQARSGNPYAGVPYSASTGSSGACCACSQGPPGQRGEAGKDGVPGTINASYITLHPYLINPH